MEPQPAGYGRVGQFRLASLDDYNSAVSKFDQLFRAADTEFSGSEYPQVRISSPDLDNGNTLTLDEPRDVVFRGTVVNRKSDQTMLLVNLNGWSPQNTNCQRLKGSAIINLGPSGEFSITVAKAQLLDCEGAVFPAKRLIFGVGRTPRNAIRRLNVGPVDLTDADAGFKEINIRVAPSGMTGYYNPDTKANILLWNKLPGATGYKVYIGRRGVTTKNAARVQDVSGETFTDSSPPTGTSSYRVLASLEKGPSDLSEEVQIEVGAAPGTVSGVVRDAVTGQPIRGAAVRIYRLSTQIAWGTTDADGRYAIAVPPGSAFRIEVQTAGYLKAEYYDIAVRTSTTTDLEIVLQIDSAHSGAGDLRGRIINALSDDGVGGLALRLRSGINVRTGTIVAQATSGSDGSYAFSRIAAGNYTIEASGDGYEATYFTVTVIGGADSNKNGFISPIVPSGETRIVLDWGADPPDLDAHLTGPTPDGGRFHTYWEAKDHSYGGFSYAKLDHDDTQGFGHETTTIYRQLPGTYRFTVHDYSNQGDSSNLELAQRSGAIVRIFTGSKSQAVPVPSGGTGTAWTVFEMSGSAITLINRFYHAPDYPTIQSLLLGTPEIRFKGKKPVGRGPSKR